MGMHHHHGHDHGHSHGHSHAPGGMLENMGRAFAIGIVLNLGYVAVEVVYGLITGSMALVADAGHNFSDVLSLVLAWGAAIMARKSATFQHTYGFRRGTVLAALISSLLLLAALGAITLEAIHRLFNPRTGQRHYSVGGRRHRCGDQYGTALLFMGGQQHDINIRGAFLHMAMDAAVSLGVVLSGIGIYSPAGCGLTR